MLSINEIKELGRVARVAIGDDEAETLCGDLNALLELSAVLETLPKEEEICGNVAALQDLREDYVSLDASFADTGKAFSVPPVMEKT